MILFFLGIGGGNFAMYTLWLPEQYRTECRASAFGFVTSVGHAKRRRPAVVARILAFAPWQTMGSGPDAPNRRDSELTGRSKTRNGDDRPSGPESWRLGRRVPPEPGSGDGKTVANSGQMGLLVEARCYLPLNNG